MGHLTCMQTLRFIAHQIAGLPYSQCLGYPILTRLCSKKNYKEAKGSKLQDPGRPA